MVHSDFSQLLVLGGGDNLQKSWHLSGVETLRPLPFDALMAFWHWERQTEANVSTKTFSLNNLREQIRFHEHLIKLMGVVRFANHVSEMRWNVWQHIRKERDILYNCTSSLELLHHFWRLSCRYNRFIRLKCLYCIAISGSRGDTFPARGLQGPAG